MAEPHAPVMRRAASLWGHRDFTNLWGAATISAFGSMITRAALPFLAVLTLDATAGQMAALRAAELVPGILVGLAAGVWVDRLRRRAVMIWADLGRALILGWVPVAAVAGLLNMPQLYAVAFAAAILTTFFDIADIAYLPSLVRRDELVEANSKLSASGSVAEVAGFGLAGWLVQWFTAPFAILVDAVSFLVSAAFLARIRTPELRPQPTGERNALREIREGLEIVAGDRVVRAVAASAATLQMSFGIFGALYTLYTARDLGFAPGILGMIYAVGGVSSVGGAVLAGPISRRLGVGPGLLAALVASGVGMGFIPLAQDATTAGAVFLIMQQIVGDSAATVFMVNQVSLRQSILPLEAMGRANAAIRVLAFAGTLTGTVIGGVLGETYSARTALAVGAAIAVVAAGWLLASPVRTLRRPNGAGLPSP